MKFLPPKPKKLIYNKAEKKRTRQRLLNKKKQDAIKEIKEKIAKMKKDGKLDINLIKAYSKINIFTVEKLSLWDIDKFTSKEVNPTQQHYQLGQDNKFADLFLTAKKGKTYGPVEAGGNQYYIKIIARELDAEIEEDSSDDSLAEQKINFAWTNQNYPKIESFKKILKDQEDYVRHRSIPLPVPSK